MDNRWRFLYYVMTELWGHGRQMRAGKGDTGASAGAVREANPPYKAEARRVANESSEAQKPAVEKSRYRS